MSLFIFSIILAVIFLSFKANFKIMSQSFESKDRLDDTSHTAYYIKREIEQSSCVCFDDFKWRDSDKSLGFVLVKDDKIYKQQAYTYVYYALKDGDIYRYTFTDKRSFDKIKTSESPSRISKNLLRQNVANFSATHDDKNIYITEDNEKFVVYIGEKLK